MTQLEAATQKPPKPPSGHHRIGLPGIGVGAFLSLYRQWLGGMLIEHEPQGIIFEAPILAAKTTPATVRKLVGLAAITQMAAHERGIRWVREAPPSQVKKHICGDGGSGKIGVQRAIMDRGWDVADDNESDALALWDFAAHLYALEQRPA